MTKFRIEMRNNSDARRADGARTILGVPAKCRHNGGKIVIATTDAADSLRAALDAALRGFIVAYEETEL